MEYQRKKYLIRQPLISMKQSNTKIPEHII
jgi:hypothetical protein